MLASILPSDVVTVAAPPDRKGDLLPEEAQVVSDAVPARQREFAAGRACARLALAQLGVYGYALLPGPGREPQWPEGIVGSITHCHEYCAAAAARRDSIAALGIDAERAGAVNAGLLDAVCTPWERRRLSESGGDGTEWATVVFSAKESFYKAYFPVTRFILEPQSIDIDFNFGAGTFTASIVEPSAPDLFGSRTFLGRFARSDTHVFCAVVLRSDSRTS